MPGVDLSQLDKLDARMNEVLRQAPEKRRELHENLSGMMKDVVDQSIDASINDARGQIKDWQKQYVGTGGGYAAVRASDESTGDKSPGAITNYVDSGHKIRPPSGRDPHYRPRINVAYVNGAHFYETAAPVVASQAVAAAEKFVADIAGILEGK
ncbi:MAG TPA: hypothetical protein VN540_08520 [Clostridia bacterium]|nr:hypothetical protein [Clostridia bacterium]